MKDQMYGGGPFAYDFGAALVDARRRAKQRAARDWNEFQIADRTYWLQEFLEAPTPEGLRRHSQRFGPEGVDEIAGVYAVDLTATTKARTPKRLTITKSRRAVNKARAVLEPEEVAA